MLPEPVAVRVSDAERDQVVALLRHHCAEGRLSLDEFAERTTRALAATAGADLAAVTLDLPPAVAPRPPAGRWVVGLLGGERRRGRWRVGERLTAIGAFGSADLDFREAEWAPGADRVVTAVAVLGSVEIVVPAGTEVELRGAAFLGRRMVEVGASPAASAGPVLRVRAIAVLGSVHVVSRRPVP